MEENQNIETKGLGAGSYPEPIESKEKSYQFDFNATCRGYGVVTARDEEDAKKLIMSNDYDDIIEFIDYKIEEITNITEE